MPMPRVPDEYFVVSSVRNPCEFAVSSWSYCCMRSWGSRHGLSEMAKWPCGEEYFKAHKCPKFSFKGGVKSRGNIQVDDVNAPAFHYLLKQSPWPLVYENVFNMT